MSSMHFVPLGKINLHVIQVDGIEYLASSTESSNVIHALPYFQVVSRLPDDWRQGGLIQIIENAIALLGAPHETHRPMSSNDHDCGGSPNA